MVAVVPIQMSILLVRWGESLDAVTRNAQSGQHEY
jgi:hypothetical protein